MNQSWLSFEGGTEADLEDFLANAPLDRPARILLTGDNWGPGTCQIVAASPPGMDLRVVSLRGAPIGDSGVKILLSSPG